MPVSDRIAKMIWGEFAGHCAICKEPLVHMTEGQKKSLIGEVAHIVGEKPGSARSESGLSEEERNAPENLLLLCRKHHKIIDDQPKEYPVERLHKIRVDHLGWVSARLLRPQPWTSTLATLFYINVPRLGEYALTKGYDITQTKVENVDNLHGLGLGLVHVMHHYKEALARLPLESIALSNVRLVTDALIGALIHFERQSFRTKNILYEERGQASHFTGDRSKDPHIYTQIADWDLVVQIDQRWITTTTAQTYFRPAGGTVSLSGFARITHVEVERKTVLASPLALGLPPNVLDPEYQDFAVRLDTGELNRQRDIRRDDDAFFSTLEDPETVKQNGTWSGELHSCDFCGRLFEHEKYMVDGPMKPNGLWGNMCASCYRVSELPLGMGLGQLYRKEDDVWHMIAGAPFREEQEIPPNDVAEGFIDWLIAQKFDKD